MLASLCLVGVSAAPAAAQSWPFSKASASQAQKPLSRAQRLQIVQALVAAPSHGLPAYDVGLDSSDEQLIAAVTDFASALHAGRMQDRWTGDWHLRPEPYDAQGAFERARSKNKVRQWLDQLGPRHAGYHSLRGALIRYREIADTGGWKKLSPKATLKVGSRGMAVMALRERLGIEYPGPLPDGDQAIFDESLSHALALEQERLGVPVTGKLDKATIAALNVPVEARIATIEANLERERWLPLELPRDRIEMNIPAYWLEVHRRGEVALAMKTVVGRPSDPTPIFQDVMHSMVFNPPWNVPQKIAQRDILPRASKDKTYLIKNDYQITEDGRVVQKAGPKSALGKVKFNLDNPFAIYFHDTPNKALFDQHARAFSNGCIRLENAAALAELALAGDRYWNEATLQNVFAAGETIETDASRSMPVFIVYRTAFVEDGRVNFRDDVYGWDSKLRQILAA